MTDTDTLHTCETPHAAETGPCCDECNIKVPKCACTNCGAGLPHDDHAAGRGFARRMAVEGLRALRARAAEIEALAFEQQMDAAEDK